MRTDTERRVAERIRELRRLRGWTQSELAARVGFARESIANIERGRNSVSLGTLDRLAQIGGVSVVWFFGEGGMRTDTERRVAERIRELRRLRGWTQSELAARVGFARESIANIERGRNSVSLGTLDRLAQIGGVSVVWFFGEEG